MRRPFGAILAVLLVIPTTVRAQVPAVPLADRATVSRTAAAPLREAVNKEAARLARASRPMSARQTLPAQRNWFARHPVLTGTLVGAGVGLAWITAEGCSGSSDYSCGGLVAFAVGTGAGLGALGGVVAAVILR